MFECAQDSEHRPRGHTLVTKLVIVIQFGESERKHTDAGIHAVGVPNSEVHVGSKLPYHSSQAQEACIWMVGQDHQVEPAMATTATVT